MEVTLVIENISELISLKGENKARAGEAQGQIERIKDGLVLVAGEKIVYAGESSSAPDYKLAPAAKRIDARGKTVTPGLIDSHTHLVHGGSREHELNMKLKGVAYLDILAAGGGIMNTLKNTQNMTEDQLYKQALASLDQLLSFGVTTVEAKTGYGIDHLETELKQLEVASRLDKDQPVDIVNTYMGAHAVPEKYKDNPMDFIDVLIEDHLPKVVEDGRFTFIDIFCEQGVFNAEEAEKLLSKGKELGLIPKIHADEIVPIGGTRVAKNVGAISADHLIAIDDQGIDYLKEGGVIANLLPGTSFNMGDHKFAPARKLIEKGVPVAISTDYNPGSCPTENIQLCMYMACLNMRMTPEEVLVATTINGAAAINQADKKGSLEEGKLADIVIFNADNFDYVLYHFGINHTDTVIKNGQVVWTRN